ncbi:MAG: S8 family serine peptidase [Rhodothermales bacterium]
MNSLLRLLLIVLLGLSTLPAHAQSSRMDAPLRALVRGHEADVRLGKAAADRTVDIFVQLENGVVPDAVRTPGMTVRTLAGDIAVVRLPIDEIPVLARMSGIRRLEASRTRHLLHDESRALIRVDQVHAGADLDRAYQGEGVVVGVLDTGIDVNHPDFRDGNGTRIQYLLEYLDPEAHTEDSREYTKADIDADASAVQQIDGDGHGTHVAGSAAGNGAGNAAMTGMAPKADLIIVKGTRAETGGGFSDADIVAGVEYIFNRAGEMGKPAVVNLSLGGHDGPHDGSSLSEQALSNLSGPGRIIVAAAGNEGFDNIHVGHSTGPGTTYLYVGGASNESQFGLNAWHDAGTVARASVGLFSLDNGVLTLVSQSDWVASGGYAEGMELTFDGEVVASAAIDLETTAHPDNGDGNLQALIEGLEGVDLSNYLAGFMIEASGTGRLDAWVFGGELINFSLPIDGYEVIPGDSDMTVGTPATAEKVLAVGAFVSKNSWTSGDGLTFLWPDPNLGGEAPEIGAYAYFSSRGPTRDGRIHPQISAPGALIFSAHSADVAEPDADRMLAGGQYIGFEGTSMASPHIAGIVALMLEADAELTYEDVVNHLSTTATVDAQTGTGPNSTFGAGKVDALAALQSVTGYSGVNTLTETELPRAVTLSQNYPNPFNPVTSVSFSLPRAMDVQVQVFDALGRHVGTLLEGPLPAGSHAVRFDAGTRPSGMYLLRLNTATTVLTRPMILLK